MKIFERLFTFTATLALIVYGSGYFEQYRTDFGRWFGFGALVFGLILFAGALVEWLEQGGYDRVLKQHEHV
ncbi:MAG: hypothetical protein WC641_07095 [Patescibacteria group bacterium]